MATPLHRMAFSATSQGRDSTSANANASPDAGSSRSYDSGRSAGPSTSPTKGELRPRTLDNPYQSSSSNSLPPVSSAALRRRSSAQGAEPGVSGSHIIQGIAGQGHTPEVKISSPGGSTTSGPVGNVTGSSTSSNGGPGPSTIASRRANAHTGTSTDFSLGALPEHPVAVRMSGSASSSRFATPVTTPGASPILSPWAKQRANLEAAAVANQVYLDEAEQAGPSSSGSGSLPWGIQRPASAPPSRRGSTFSALTAIGHEPKQRKSGRSTVLDPGTEDPHVIEEPTLISPGGRRGSLAGATSLNEVFALPPNSRARTLLFISIMAWGAVQALDRLTTYSYQTIATNSFAHHSSLAMVNVIRAITAAVAGPPFAVIADTWGRTEACVGGVVLYCAGHALLAVSQNVAMYIGGVTLFELGCNGLNVLQQIILADMTSSKDRLLFLVLPQLPFLFFSFVSSDIFESVMPRWRWGVGMFSILGAATILPLILILTWQDRQRQAAARLDARQGGSAAGMAGAGGLPSSPSKEPRSTSPRHVIGRLELLNLVNRTDLIGLGLLSASLALLLIPLTLAAATPSRWHDAEVLAMVSAGAVLLPIFLLWERRWAKIPALRDELWRSRTFWFGGLALGSVWCGMSIMTAFFPTYLYVVHGVSNRKQQNISVLFSFTQAAASIPVALVVRWTRRSKPFAVFGLGLCCVGLGIMANFKGTQDTLFQIIASQIVLGLGGASSISVIQALCQVDVPHHVVAQTIANLNIMIQIGVATGSAIAGALWSNLLPGLLSNQLKLLGEQNQLTTIFAEPLTWITEHPLGSSVRTLVVNAYGTVWRDLLLASVAFAAIAIVASLGMRNPILNDGLSTSSAASVAAGKAKAISNDDEDSTSPGVSLSLEASKSTPRLFGDSFLDRMDHALGRSCPRCVRKSVRRSTVQTPPSIHLDDAGIRAAGGQFGSHVDGNVMQLPIRSKSALGHHSSAAPEVAAAAEGGSPSSKLKGAFGGKVGSGSSSGETRAGGSMGGDASPPIEIVTQMPGVPMTISDGAAAHHQHHRRQAGSGGSVLSSSGGSNAGSVAGGAAAAVTAAMGAGLAKVKGRTPS